MSFYNGILNLTNWAGNVIMPTLGALFIAVAVIQFARGYHNLYSTWAYGGLMCLMVSGLLRMFEKFTGQLGWNNPDLYWNSLLNLVDWFANVILPVYAGMHVAVGALKFGGLLNNRSTTSSTIPGISWGPSCASWPRAYSGSASSS